MEASLSRKIRNISFLLMILVACIHGYNYNLSFTDQAASKASSWLSFIQHFSSDGFCRIAVPVFFAVSGYLASESIRRKLDLPAYAGLLRKRIFSLLIPYLLVSAAGLALVFLLQLLPASRPFFIHYSLEHISLSELLRMWLLDPVPFPLWFIRFLLNYFLFFPVLYFGVRFLREAFLFAAMLAWMWPFLYHQFGIWKITFSLCTFLFCLLSGTDFTPYLPTQKNELEGLFFFTLGIYASIHRIPLIMQAGKKWLLWLLPVWLCWVAYRSLLVLQDFPAQMAIHYHQVAFTLAGSILIWYLYDFFAADLDRLQWLRRFSTYSVGVFLFHEPLLTILKKGLVRIGGGGDFSLLLSFLISPVLAFLGALWFSVYLARWFPAVYRLFTGNRSPAGSEEAV